MEEASSMLPLSFKPQPHKTTRSFRTTAALHLSTAQLLRNLFHPLLILPELRRGSHGILNNPAHSIRHTLVPRLVSRLVNHVLDTIGRPKIPHASSFTPCRLEISV